MLVAAATTTACRELIRGSMVSICWDGGRHHALRDRASGFCYVADIVLGIMLLAKEGKPRSLDPPAPVSRRHKRTRIMYIDLDLHHGDGVAKAFHSPTHYLTGKERPPQVLTLSVHHSSPSFFPAPTPLSTPDTSSPFTLVVPLDAYPTIHTYHRVFIDCIEPVRKAFDPDYIVLQLGADGMPADRIGQYGAWNADGVGGMTWCAEQVKSWGIPMCVLGGGGYDHGNTARAWSKVTAALVSQAYTPRQATRF
jgi:acetoin utilization deacetylase AcuC-like enzyme